MCHRSRSIAAADECLLPAYLQYVTGGFQCSALSATVRLCSTAATGERRRICFPFGEGNNIIETAWYYCSDVLYNNCSIWTLSNSNKYGCTIDQELAFSRSRRSTRVHGWWVARFSVVITIVWKFFPSTFETDFLSLQHLANKLKHSYRSRSAVLVFLNLKSTSVLWLVCAWLPCN